MNMEYTVYCNIYDARAKKKHIQFNSVYLYSAKLQQLSSQGTLNDMVQFKPIGIKFIVIII